MRTYVVERLVDTVLTCVAISFVVFVFLHLAGDPAKVLLPPEASKEAVADLRQSLGLDSQRRYRNGLRALAGGWTQQQLETFEAATAVFEKIDDDLWK